MPIYNDPVTVDEFEKLKENYLKEIKEFHKNQDEINFSCHKMIKLNVNHIEEEHGDNEPEDEMYARPEIDGPFENEIDDKPPFSAVKLKSFVDVSNQAELRYLAFFQGDGSFKEAISHIENVKDVKFKFRFYLLSSSLIEVDEKYDSLYCNLTTGFSQLETGDRNEGFAANKEINRWYELTLLWPDTPFVDIELSKVSTGYLGKTEVIGSTRIDTEERYLSKAYFSKLEFLSN